MESPHNIREHTHLLATPFPAFGSTVLTSSLVPRFPFAPFLRMFDHLTLAVDTVFGRSQFPSNLLNHSIAF